MTDIVPPPPTIPRIPVRTERCKDASLRIIMTITTNSSVIAQWVAIMEKGLAPVLYRGLLLKMMRNGTKDSKQHTACAANCSKITGNNTTTGNKMEIRIQPRIRDFNSTTRLNSY